MRFGRGHLRVSAIATGVIAIALLAPSSASAATIANGGFETNNLSGWQLSPTVGGWQTYSGTTSPGTAQTVASPPQGTFAAITDTSAPGNRILYQDLALEP